MDEKTKVALEIGQKKIFASALDWPGWARSGRDEGLAVQALINYGPRYGEVLRSMGTGFQPPEDPAEIEIIERLDGNSTTDFGAPARPTSSDESPVGEAELEYFHSLLEACWAAFDRAATEAEGRVLRKGPRGGGRELVAIRQHILGADCSYLGKIGWKVKVNETAAPEAEINRIRQEILLGLKSSAAGELPKKGPRGGRRWTPRYFVRRVVWHVLDHAWEIEDRIE
jgi:hypothetical protein